MDNAPLGMEFEVTKRLEEARQLGEWLRDRIGDYVPLKAWFFREMGRLVGIEGGEPLSWIEKSLGQAARLEQWGEIAKCRNFLNFSQAGVTSSLSARQLRELRPLLESVPHLTGSSTREELRSRLLTSLLQLVPMESAVWLEKSGDWEALDWFPRHIAPRYSRRLVEHCLQTQELSWGQPEQLKASHSLLLSEVRSLIACPVGSQGVLFAWQSSQQNWLSQDQVEAFRFLAKLAGQLQANLELADRIKQELANTQRLHRRWQLIVENSHELGLAELDDEGRLVHWNAAFQRLFQSVHEGQEASQLLPEPERRRDKSELASLTARSAQSRLVRVADGKQPRWIQLTDWKVSDHAGIFRAALDVSRHDVVHWFEYLEEMRHLLASDLHDGPAQLAATQALSTPSAESRGAADEIRYRLDFLRSPWVEGEDAAAWLLEYAETHFPESRVILEREGPPLTRSQEQFLQRARLGVLDVLRESRKEVQELSFAAGELIWKPGCAITIPESLSLLLDCGSEVLGGSWFCEPGRLVVSPDGV